MDLTNTNKAVEKYAERVVKRAQFNLKVKGFGGQKSNRSKNSSGKLLKSLGYKIKSKKNGLTLDFTSSVNYAAIVEDGRRKGKMPPVGAIEQWIKDKPIRLQKTIRTNGFATKRFTQKTPKSIRSAAFAMAKSISKRNIPPVPYFGEALDSEYDKSEDIIKEGLVNDFEDLIFNDFQKYGSGS